MSSESAPSPSRAGHATIAGGTVYYLHEAPSSNTDRRNELRVLESFLAAWNSDTPDDPSLAPSADRKTPEKPSGTKAPPIATILIVTKLNHKSTHSGSSDQDKHLTVYVCTDATWAATPSREYGATVHVFATNEDPAQGYRGYYKLLGNRQKMNGPGIKTDLEKAQATNFGVLGQGHLA